MFKVYCKNTRTTSLKSICCFIINFEHVSHLSLVFLLLTLNKIMLAVSMGLKAVDTKSLLLKKLIFSTETLKSTMKISKMSKEGEWSSSLLCKHNRLRAAIFQSSCSNLYRYANANTYKDVFRNLPFICDRTLLTATNL